MRVLITKRLDREDMNRIIGSFPDAEIRAADRVYGATHTGFSPHILFCEWLDAETVEALVDLRWVQVPSAGVDGLPLRDMAARGITLTNGSGTHGTSVAETVLAMMLALAIGLPDLVRAQGRREWVRPSVAPRRFELEEQTLLVIGLGDVGRTLARKCIGIGMRVLGHDIKRPDEEGVPYHFVPIESLDSALAEADHVALCLPFTRETARFMGRERLGLMKPSAFLYNAGRGSLVDQDALIESLQKARIAGAGLDVTDPEPLPPDSPLWTMPNVLLTQHMGGASPHNSRRITDLFIENLRRYMNGEPLLNVVDLDRGY